MRSIALFGIATYQRYVSPYKGYCCAYRTHTGRRSCSVLGYRAVRRYGIRSGIAMLRQRFVRCADALQALRTLPTGIERQRGFCDLGCDLPSLDCAGGALDAFACCDVPGDCGDWGGRKKPKATEPTMVDLTPPRSADRA